MTSWKGVEYTEEDAEYNFCIFVSKDCLFSQPRQIGLATSRRGQEHNVTFIQILCLLLIYLFQNILFIHF